MTILEIGDEPNIVFTFGWSEQKIKKYGLLMLPPKLGTFMAISLISMKFTRTIMSHLRLVSLQEDNRKRDRWVYYVWLGWEKYD
jgi:hypothetical protein